MERSEKNKMDRNNDDTNRRNLILIGILSILAVLGCTKTEAEKKSDIERKEGPAKMFAAKKDFTTKPSKVELTQQPYIKGKTAFLYSLNGGEFGYHWTPALDPIAAKMPEDVGTVVLQECKSVQVGFYRVKEDPSKTVAAMVLECEVTLIDRSIASVIHIKRFQGKASDEVKVGQSSNSVTAGPTEEINAFLAALPRR
jgi:hypothetical protein